MPASPARCVRLGRAGMLPVAAICHAVFRCHSKALRIARVLRYRSHPPRLAISSRRDHGARDRGGGRRSGRFSCGWTWACCRWSSTAGRTAGGFTTPIPGSNYHQRRQSEHDAANPDGAPYLLEPEDCAELLREGVQYYHRYMCFWHLGFYELCARDTERNLRLFAFVREHARTIATSCGSTSGGRT